MKLNRELARMASANGICTDWLTTLKETTDIDALLDMYIKGIDFCLSTDYPSNDYIRKHFKGRMEHKGIHLDEEVSGENDRVCVLLGRSTGDVHVGGYNVSEVFLKHTSELTLKVEDKAFVMVDMFDNSKLSLVAIGEAKVCVNHYGGELIYHEEDNAKIKVIYKNKKTY